MKVCRGFTLLELMVTIAVLAILTTLGVPGFQDLIQNNRVTTQANELVTALSFARTEAVKRGRNVQVAITQANPGWNATVSIVGVGGDPLRVTNRQGSRITVNAANVTFDPTGVPINVPIGGQIFDMQPQGGCTGEKRRRITVGVAGQITMLRQNCL